MVTRIGSWKKLSIHSDPSLLKSQIYHLILILAVTINEVFSCIHILGIVKHYTWLLVSCLYCPKRDLSESV